MKLDRSFLNTGKVEAKMLVAEEVPLTPELEKAFDQMKDNPHVPQESLRSKEPAKFKFEYDPNLICPTQLAEKNSIHDTAVKYCEEFGIKVTEHLAEAMERRAAGERVLSPREADIVARGKVALDNDFLWKSMEIVHGYMQEGEANFRLNPWELRSRYNNGLHWKNTSREKASAAQKLKGDEILLMLIQTLDAYKLPLYPAEKGIGVSREFCKPEFLTWEQYELIRSGFKMGTEEHQKELLT